MSLLDNEARIGLKPDLKAFVLSPKEVALIGERSRVALRGQAYPLLVPHLDGTRTCDEVVEAVASELAPTLAYTALARLETKGFLGPAEAPGRRPGPAAAGLPVALKVIGVEKGVREILLSKLVQSLPIVEEVSAAALEVCLIDDYLRPEVARSVRDAAQAGRPLLPVKPVGRHIWVGPFVDAETAAAWPLFEERLRSNRPVDVAVLSSGSDFPLVPLRTSPESLDAGLALAGLAICESARGRVPSAIQGAIWTIDAENLSVERHSLPKRETATGARHAGTEREAASLVLAPCPKRFKEDGGHRSCPPSETLERLTPLVSPITGLIRGLERCRSPEGIHVYAAAQSWPGRGGRLQDNRALGNPAGAGGKGKTAAQAKVSCIAEAVERHSCGFFADSPTFRAHYDEIAAQAVHPNEILLVSDEQYRRREATNGPQSLQRSYSWVPEPFDPEKPIGWTPLWSLSHRRTRFVPSALCYFGYGQGPSGDEQPYARTNSNGCAAGNTLSEAILQALFEAIERDACALWWYSRARRPAIDVASFRDPFFDAMAESYRSRGRCLAVLDLTSDVGVPVALAASWTEAEGRAIHLGLGCHLEPRLAVARALSELNQVAHSCLEDDVDSERQRNYDRDHLEWLRHADIGREPYVVPLAGKALSAGELQDLSSDDISRDVTTCVERLKALGLETLVLDHTRPDVGFPTARVVVPGLRHFWARLAPGRLYEVPPALGWIERPLAEGDLNPLPFFL